VSHPPNPPANFHPCKSLIPELPTYSRDYLRRTTQQVIILLEWVLMLILMLMLMLMLMLSLSLSTSTKQLPAGGMLRKSPYRPHHLLSYRVQYSTVPLHQQLLTFSITCTWSRTAHSLLSLTTATGSEWPAGQPHLFHHVSVKPTC
jgi:hypothetical protein